MESIDRTFAESVKSLDFASISSDYMNMFEEKLIATASLNNYEMFQLAVESLVECILSHVSCSTLAEKCYILKAFFCSPSRKLLPYPSSILIRGRFKYYEHHSSGMVFFQCFGTEHLERFTTWMAFKNDSNNNEERVEIDGTMGSGKSHMLASCCLSILFKSDWL